MRFQYGGHGNPQTYVGFFHPEGVQLQARPGDVVDFGEGSPPRDGAWYAIGDDGHPTHWVAPPPAVPKLEGTAS